jgi:hypothetical protein
MSNSLPEISKVSFWEEFSFQFYNSYDSNFKQNGFSLMHFIFEKDFIIFGGLEDQVWNLEKGEMFLSGTDGQSVPPSRTVRARPCVRVVHAELLRHAPLPAPPPPPTHLRPLPLPCLPQTHQKPLPFLTFFSIQAMEEETSPTKSTTTLTGVRRRITGGRHRRASPLPHLPLPRRKSRRKPSPSFFIFFPKHPWRNSARSTPTPPYANKRPIAHALHVIGELSSPIPLSLLLSNKPHKYPSSL